MTERPFSEYVESRIREGRNMPHSNPHAYALGALESEAGARIQHLFRQIGQRATCTRCGQPIWWVTHTNQKRCAYSTDAVPHAAVCPAGAGGGNR